DLLDTESAQRCLAFPANRLRTQDALGIFDRILRIPHEPAFGEDVWSLRAFALLEQSTDDLFGVAESVNCGCVDPVDSQIERVIHRGDGFVVVLRSPAERPATAPDCPGAESDASDVQVSSAKLSSGKCGAHDLLRCTLVAAI